MGERRGVRRVWGKINGSNAVDVLRSQVVRLEKKLDSIKEEIANDVATAQQATHDTIIAKTRYYDSLNQQLVGAYLEEVLNRDKSKRAIFIFGTHEWGNIGDLAISYSELSLLEKAFPDFAVYSLSRLTLLSNWQRIVTTITDNDVIVIPGGGNMGDIWPREEFARRKIVETFQNNTIISFPQSIKFSDKQELAKSAKVYSSHRKLLIALRDDASYKIAQEAYKGCTLVRTEDIVMNYEYPVADWSQWDRVLFVMRGDAEKRANSGIEQLFDRVNQLLPSGTTDTVVPDFGFVSTEYGAKLVYQKIDEFHSSRLVITDRLHGAIFALQAGKPVIIFDNTYGKIAGALKRINQELSDRILFANEDGSNITIDDVKRMYALEETDRRPYSLLAQDIATFTKEVRRFITQK